MMKKIKKNTVITMLAKTALLQSMGLALLAANVHAETGNHDMMTHGNHAHHKQMADDAMNHDEMSHAMHANHADTKHTVEMLTPQNSLEQLKAQGFYVGNHHTENVHSDHDDDPLLTKVLIDQLEVRQVGGEKTTVLEAEAWVGYDLNKLWFVVDAERHKSELEELKLSLHYGRAVSAYWDVIAGVRQEIKPHKATWGVVGLKGLAPYFFETDATLAVNKEGVFHANLTAEYEAMLTQKWVLSPEFSVNAYSKATAETGKGVSDASLGLRLRYEVQRELAPYVGVVSSWKLGDTAEMVRDEGHDTQVTQAVFGVHAWF